MESLIKIIAAIVMPPLGAFLQVGVGANLVINILLTTLGWLPGVVHALWLMLERKY